MATTQTQVQRCEGENMAASGWTHRVQCDRPATVIEPAFKSRWSYAEGKIVEIPNAKWDGTSYEGKRFCGTHSPSRKASREVQKAKARQEEYERRARVADIMKDGLENALAKIEMLCSTDEERAAFQTVKNAATAYRRPF